MSDHFCSQEDNIFDLSRKIENLGKLIQEQNNEINEQHHIINHLNFRIEQYDKIMEDNGTPGLKTITQRLYVQYSQITKILPDLQESVKSFDILTQVYDKLSQFEEEKEKRENAELEISNQKRKRRNDNIKWLIGAILTLLGIILKYYLTK